ncbi:hypothetical protein KAU11_07060 [Candidatus Babeliales bacterium]|nr:hypothetical protein [Candidatus Babeliales bacterium]
MCNCFENTLERIRDKIKENIPTNAIEYECDWKGKVFRFDGGLGIGLYVEYEYRNIKKDSTPYANKKRESNFIALSYCPFCGEKIVKKGK